MQSKHINGVKCYAPLSREQLIDFAFKEKCILIALNAEKILHATEHSRKIINRNVAYPDGMGAVWALQKKGAYVSEKIPGCELWLDIIKRYKDQKSFYLIGGKEEVIAQTVTQLKNEFNKIEIKGYRNGYIQTKKEKKNLIQDIITKRPDVVFVAMGSPKQEELMEEIQKEHAALYQGLGGSFDVYTGHVKRAPEWWIEHNLEWAYRLINQPSRIKRQIFLFKFIVKLYLGRY